MWQNTGMGEDDDQNNITKNAHQGDHRVYATVKNIVNNMVTRMTPHDQSGYCGSVGSCFAFMLSLSMNLNTQRALFAITYVTLVF